ncbi:MAG: dihydropteroate synthase [Rhodothermales bacterium]
MLAENSTLVDFDPARFFVNCRGRILDCRPRQEIGAQVMGILNVTPDSFADGGRYLTADAAIGHAAEMIREGAAIIDIGGESSRPAGTVYGSGAPAVHAAEEIRRVLPVIEAVAAQFPNVLISVDTYKPEVALAALEAGAHIVNDVTGLRYTTETAAVAAEYGAALVVMHSLGRPGDPPLSRDYVDVVSEVRDSLEESVGRALEAGIEHVIVDPGFGFGKSAEENLLLLRNVESFLNLNRPVLIGVSRKSTIGAVLGSPGEPVPPEARLFGSLGAAAVAVVHGASIIRSHDVRPTVEMLRTVGAILNA